MKLLKLSALSILTVSTLLMSVSSVMAEESEETTATITFRPNEGPVTPPDPEIPGPGEPGPEGPVTPPPVPGPFGIWVPVLDFGINDVSSENDYSALALQLPLADGSQETAPRAHYLAVNDSRGTNEGWTLSVILEGDGFVDNDTDDILEGAELRFTGASAYSENDSQLGYRNEFKLDAESGRENIFWAQADNGQFISMLRWGAVADLVDGRNPNITLNVPTPTVGNYEATLNWSLTSGPPVE